MYVYTTLACLVPTEAGRHHWISWNCSSRQCGELPCGFQESSVGPLEEQPILLTTELSLQPILYFYFWDDDVIAFHPSFSLQALPYAPSRSFSNSWSLFPSAASRPWQSLKKCWIKQVFCSYPKFQEDSTRLRKATSLMVAGAGASQEEVWPPWSLGTFWVLVPEK